uniref:Uridine kinase n=1 Tax=Candidatus Aschnera chinzeii TaxID=1485666 RepID=A0AAT9G531_9ENTR|nr:MAG: uridine kinase [Candidatus Aschnera chinzeii]
MINFINKKCTIVGIAGSSASGKSLVAKTIYHELCSQVGNQNIGVISEDCYYKDQCNIPIKERIKVNYDHPCSIDHHLLMEHIKLLKMGNNIRIPQYDYTNHTRKKTTLFFSFKKVIIIEGILLLMDKKLRKHMDFTIYIDTPLDICLVRRIKRDVNERGRTLNSVIKQYMKTVRPMFFQFIEPSKRYADIIIPRGGKNRIAIDILKAKIWEFCR